MSSLAYWLQPIMKEAQEGTNWEAGTKVETMEKHCSRLADLPRNGLAHSELGPPPSTSNLESASLTAEAPSCQMTPSLGQVDS